MKFPSVKSLAQSAVKTIIRFPFELLFALAGTVAVTILIQNDKATADWQNCYYRIMMTANLGLLLCLATTLFTESSGMMNKKKYLLKLAIALAAASLFLILNPDEHTADYLRFFLFSLGFHLLVSFSAFTSGGSVQGFWQFNKAIFLQFLTSVLFSGVLFLGLMAAINATTFLFNLHFSYKADVTLFAWIAGIFNTIFFLSGVPDKTTQLHDDFSYPKGLKIFTQYILIPLATVYVLILLTYEVKITMLWSMPKGLVSDLVLGYAVFGILSTLLVYPIREQEENKWIKTYSRSFYVLLIPLIVLLFLAIFARAVPYGITEPRYFLLVLALWLSFITAYFLFSKKQNIKLIPVSLCVVTLLSIYGPQSAFNISKYSQRHMLVKLFEKYGKYKDGKLVPMGNKKMNQIDGINAVSKINYLVDGKEMSALQGYVDTDLSAVFDSLSKHVKHNPGNYFYKQAIKNDEAEWVTKYLGLDKFAGDNPWYDVVNYSFTTSNDLILNVNGYDYVTRLEEGFSSVDTTTLKGDGVVIQQISDTSSNCKLVLNKQRIVFDLKLIADSLIKHESEFKPYIKNPDVDATDFMLPAEKLMVYRQSPGYSVILAMDKLILNYKHNKVFNVSEVSGYYLIKHKQQ